MLNSRTVGYAVLFREPTFHADRGALQGTCAPKKPRCPRGRLLCQRDDRGRRGWGAGEGDAEAGGGGRGRESHEGVVHARGHLCLPSRFSESTRALGTRPGCPRRPAPRSGNRPPAARSLAPAPSRPDRCRLRRWQSPPGHHTGRPGAQTPWPSLRASGRRAALAISRRFQSQSLLFPS